MGKNALGKLFNRLCFFLAALPLAVIALIFYQSAERPGIERLAIPVLGYLLFLCCLLVIISIFKKRNATVALTIESMSLESQNRNAELDALREISEIIRNDISADDLLTLILEKAMQVVGVLNGSIFLVDTAEPDGLRLISAKPPLNPPKETAGAGPQRYLFVKSVIESGKAMRIQNIEDDPRTMKSNDPRYGAPSFISLPVYKNKQVVAVMNLANKEDGGIFTEHDERVLTIMLGTISVGIENISLRNILEKSQENLKSLNSTKKN
jgi:K+-sensing histidine kinase KdpD